MQKVTDFIKRHKVVSIIIIIFLGIVFLDSLINGDFTDFVYFVKSFIYLAVMIYILFLMVSKKEYYCPKCNAKLKSKTSICPNCGSESTGDKIEIKSKRIISKSKLFIHIGGSILFAPLAMSFLFFMVAAIFGALSSSSLSISDTIFVFYTNESFLPITIALSLIGIILIVIGYIFKKKENDDD